VCDTAQRGPGRRAVSRRDLEVVRDNYQTFFEGAAGHPRVYAVTKANPATGIGWAYGPR